MKVPCYGQQERKPREDSDVYKFQMATLPKPKRPNQ